MGEAPTGPPVGAAYSIPGFMLPGCGDARPDGYATRSPVVYLETYTDGLFLERREEIDQYRSLWDRIRDAALPPDRTVEFLRSLLTL